MRGVGGPVFPKGSFSYRSILLLVAFDSQCVCLLLAGTITWRSVSSSKRLWLRSSRTAPDSTKVSACTLYGKTATSPFVLIFTVVVLGFVIFTFLCVFQVDVVACAHALQLAHLYLRRSAQVSHPSLSRRLGRARNLLLNKSVVCQIIKMSWVEVVKDVWIGLCRPPRLHSLTQPRRYASIRSASTSAPGSAPLIVREMTQTTTTHRVSAAILGNFYLYNDFICNSVNKWLYQFIPVRWQQCVGLDELFQIMNFFLPGSKRKLSRWLIVLHVKLFLYYGKNEFHNC